LTRAALSLILLAALSTSALAYEVSEHLEVYGLSQAWLTLHEQMEETQGLFQHPSRDEAVDSATGFRLHRARAGLRVRVLDGLLGLHFQLKMESGVEILDLCVQFRPLAELAIMVGQFKIPSLWENRLEDDQLDFLLRTELSGLLADFALSRTHYPSSLFHGNRSQLRDFGLGVRAEIDLWGHALRAFAMLGNGLGGNLFVGGATQKEFLIANRGQFFYAGRLEAEIVPGWLELGGHVSYNRHDNVVLNSGRVTLDLDRLSWSADARLALGESGVRLTGAYGWVAAREDAYGDSKVDFRARGWEARLVWRLNPLLTFLGLDDEWLGRHAFELGARYEELETEVDESGAPTRRRIATAGAAYFFREYLALRFNAILRWMDEPFMPDLDDDAYILGLQVSF
jgi:hypothetical protein